MTGPKPIDGSELEPRPSLVGSVRRAAGRRAIRHDPARLAAARARWCDLRGQLVRARIDEQPPAGDPAPDGTRGPPGMAGRAARGTRPRPDGVALGAGPHRFSPARTVRGRLRAPVSPLEPVLRVPGTARRPWNEGGNGGVPAKLVLVRRDFCWRSAGRVTTSGGSTARRPSSVIPKTRRPWWRGTGPASWPNTRRCRSSGPRWPDRHDSRRHEWTVKAADVQLATRRRGPRPGRSPRRDQGAGAAARSGHPQGRAGPRAGTARRALEGSLRRGPFALGDRRP